MRRNSTDRTASAAADSLRRENTIRIRDLSRRRYRVNKGIAGLNLKSSNENRIKKSTRRITLSKKRDHREYRISATTTTYTSYKGNIATPNHLFSPPPPLRSAVNRKAGKTTVANTLIFSRGFEFFSVVFLTRTIFLFFFFYPFVEISARNNLSSGNLWKSHFVG